MGRGRKPFYPGWRRVGATSTAQVLVGRAYSIGRLTQNPADAGLFYCYSGDVDKTKVIAVVGPTASGKSSLGIYLAQKLKGEVISADSRQVYKGLNIGTGKVTKKEMAGIRHHLLSVSSPKKQFTVDDFVRLAEKAHSNILQNVRMTIVVGGTGLYMDALLGRISYPNGRPEGA